MPVAAQIAQSYVNAKTAAWRFVNLTDILKTK